MAATRVANQVNFGKIHSNPDHALVLRSSQLTRFVRPYAGSRGSYDRTPAHAVRTTVRRLTR